MQHLGQGPVGAASGYTKWSIWVGGGGWLVVVVVMVGHEPGVNRRENPVPDESGEDQ